MKGRSLFTMLGVMCLVLMDFSSARGTEFSDDFNRADSTTLGNGWTEVQGDLKILSNELRNEAIKIYHIAIQDGISGAVQDVACDFARTTLNGGPRFGVMLRYQDSQNYYYFYRQTGGTARVYIAKVVNGTLTNLGNAASTNPGVNVVFRIEGLADGTTLKLKLDGVEKVSVTDSTYSSGKVGIQFGPASNTDSHRADNFSAAIDVAPVAAFTGSPTSGDYPLTVNFTDQTQAVVTSWSWDFGDSGTSTAQNPSHIYNSAGSFTVSLTVTSSSGSDIETKPNYIVVTTPPVPDANFTGTPLYGNLPMTVQFTNHTTGTVTSWSWTFGDGGTAAAKNPAHTYNYAGLFTVSLTANGPSGTDTETKTNYVTVNTPPAPVAAFTGSPTSGDYPLLVNFTDQSTNQPYTWSWDFGDGGTSTTRYPSHTYQSAGSFTVSLTVTGYGGSDNETKVNYITTTVPPAPNADFSGSPTSGPAQLTVNFTDLSTGSVTAWSWDFGDSGTSAAKNPSHIYQNAGIYNVSLTAIGPTGTDTELKGSYITVNPAPPSAAFSGMPTSGNAPLTVSFTDSSTGNISSWSWTFGDSGTSTVRHPTHTYQSAGTYTVSLTVRGSDGSDVETKNNYIVASNPPPPPAPNAAFSGSPRSGGRPLTVDFTDQSSGTITGWSWTFGDSGTSTLAYPSHTYNSAGSYTVSLTVSGPGGNDTETKSNYIIVSSSAVPSADFSALPTSGNPPMTVSFTDLSTGTVTGWSWNFGDSGTSTVQNPSHIYQSVGSYTVSLTATGPSGTDTETKTNYIVVANWPPVETWTTYNNSNTGGAIGNNSILAAATESGGVRWFGTNGGGVAKYNGTTWTKYTTSNGLANNTVYGIAVDGSSNKWFATNGGVNKYTGTSWTKYTTAQGLASNATRCVAADNSGEIWVGTSASGLSRYNGTSWTKYNTGNSGLAANAVRGVAVDSSNNKWIATSNGVSKYDGTTWTNYGKPPLVSLDAAAVAVAPNGDKWIGTSSGVNRLVGTSWTSYTTNDGLAKNDTLSIAVDSSGIVWAGSNNSGVSKFTGTTPWTVYSTSNSGLVNNIVNAITTESSKNQWFGTDAGVSWHSMKDPAHAAISPDSLTFNLNTGSQGSQNVMLSNTGEATLTFTYTGQSMQGQGASMASEGLAAQSSLLKDSGISSASSLPEYEDHPGRRLSEAVAQAKKKVADEKVVVDEKEMFDHEYVQGELLVGLKGDADVGEFASSAAGDIDKMGATMIVKKELHRCKSGGAGALRGVTSQRQWILTKFDGNQDIKEIRRTLLKNPRVSYVEPNYRVKADLTPNDPQFGSQWALKNTGQSLFIGGDTYPGGTPGVDIDATAAWDITTGSDSVLVGIIDTGIDYRHEDLIDNIWTNPGEIPGNSRDDDGNGYIDDVHGYDFVNNDSDPLDDNNHGTHVSGTIAAKGNNGIGVAGIAWKAKLVALKFLDADGYGSTADAVEALHYANIMDIPITNNSWGGYGYSQALKDEIDYAYSLGHIVVAAAGNDGVDNDGYYMHYPSSYNSANIISVGATGRYDDYRPWSNYGQMSVDLAGPGSLILSTILDKYGGYDYFSGTSMATPHVTGTAALLKACNPALSMMEIKDIILGAVETNTIQFPEGQKVLTGGRLNAYNALSRSARPSISVNPSSGNVPGSGNQNLSITVSTTNVIGGTYLDYVNLSTNDPGRPVVKIAVTTNVTGTRRLSASAVTSYSFDSGVMLGQTRQIAVKLSNSGTGSTTVNSISINDSHFTADRATPVIVPASGCTYLMINYTPTTISKNTATVTISSNAQDYPSIVVNVSGYGTRWTVYNQNNTNGQIAGDYPIGTTVNIDSGGVVWAGWTYSSGGLLKFDGSVWTGWTPANGLPDEVIWDIAFDSSNNKWLATGYGVSKFDGTTFTNYLDGTYYAAAVDTDGTTIWFGSGSYHGVYKYSGGNWTNYTVTGTGGALPSNVIYDIAVESNGTKWFATASGAAKFNGTSWTKYMSGVGCYSVGIAPDGKKWFLTASDIRKFDGSNWTTYNTQNGVPLKTTVIEGGNITFDNNGIVWASAYEGSPAYTRTMLRFNGTKWTRFDMDTDWYRFDSAYNYMSPMYVYVKSPTELWLGDFSNGILKFEIPANID